MFCLGIKKSIYSPWATDMRKYINDLSLLVADQFDLDIFSGSLFAFCNRRRDLIRILYWADNGLHLDEEIGKGCFLLAGFGTGCDGDQPHCTGLAVERVGPETGP